MTSAWREPPSRDDRAEGDLVEPNGNQLEMFETAPRGKVETLPPLADLLGDASRETGAQRTTDVTISGASKRDFLNVAGADTDELRRLEDSIRWLMNESTVRRLPRAATLPPVRGLPPVPEKDPADDALLLNPEALFPPRSSRRRGGVIRGVAKFLLASAVAAPTAYFVANWMQRAGSVAPSDASAVARSFEERVAAMAPVPKLAPAEGARLADELLGAPQPEPMGMRGMLPAEGSSDATADASPVEVTFAPEQPPAASAPPPDPPPSSNGRNDLAASNPPPSPAAPAKLALSAREIATLLERGRVLFDAGDVAAARLFFRRAANAGDATAALAMGSTYDPDILAKHFVRGIGADPEEARMWYEKARVLGSPEGPRRIEMLAHR